MVSFQIKNQAVKPDFSAVLKRVIRSGFNHVEAQPVKAEEELQLVDNLNHNCKYSQSEGVEQV